MMSLRDISALTGYSVSVVSRALSSDPEVSSIISPSTRKVIHDAVSRSGFKPNHVASCMRRGVNPSLGVFLLRKSGSLICDTVIGISEEAATRNWPLNFYFGPVDDFCQFLKRMSKQKNMGVIAYHSVLKNRMNENCAKSISQYCSLGGKLVCLNHYPGGETETVENISQLRFADYQGGVLAAEFLHSHGCVKLLSFALGDDYCFQARMSGFSDYCQKHGLDYQVFPHEVSEREWHERHRAVIEQIEPHLSSESKLGVFIPSDHVLLSCAGYLLERGVAIGRDIHLVGYDDNDFSRFQPWPFATLKQDFLKEGRLAVKMLANLLKGEPGQKMELAPELVLWNYPKSQQKCEK